MAISSTGDGQAVCLCIASAEFERALLPQIAGAATRICSDPAPLLLPAHQLPSMPVSPRELHQMQELPFVQVRATSRQILSARTRRVECAASGDASAGALDSGADVRERRHRVLMRRPASPFAISNAVRGTWLGAGTHPPVGQIAEYEREASWQDCGARTRRTYRSARRTRIIRPQLLWHRSMP